MILWGPPGTGKTTLAKLLAENSDAHWIAMSAVLAGVANVRAAIVEAQKRLPQQTVLFVDEVHRFNKAQQDAFLPHVESGLLVMVGATTENPSFEVNSALLSRSRVYVLYRLTEDELGQLADGAIRAVAPRTQLDRDARRALCHLADGDARRLLNTLELILSNCEGRVSLQMIETAAGHSFRQFDKGGDAFYDLISVLHKSIRGSDPDAALYWFARMLDGGCDPLYIARRLIRIATEDIGTADPRCLTLAVSARDAYQQLGSPEGELALAEAVVYFATVPKSNAVDVAFKRAMASVKEGKSYAVPLRFRNAPTRLAKSLRHGERYRYAHDEEGAFVAGERYFPDDMPEQRYYEPSDRGVEASIAERLTTLRELNRRTRQ